MRAAEVGFRVTGYEVDPRRLAALREGRGAFALHGRMIDPPVVEQARATLARVRGG